MTRIESIIIDYCKKEKPTNALLIDGKWGEGKTHFLKNDIATKIKSENKDFIYVSLNGITDVEEIRRLILEAKIPVLNNKGVKFIGNLVSSASKMFSSTFTKGFFTIDFTKFFSGNNIDIKSLLSFNNTVMCFDDLERISSKLKVEDVLGFINTNFVEHNNVNTIMVCDVSKIDQSENKDKSFNIIKEKLIGRVLRFEYDTNKVLELCKNEIISFGENEKQFYLKHEATFSEFFQKTNIKNLRTVYFITDNLKLIIPHIKEEIDIETISNILNFTLIISSEFKRGKFERKQEFYQTSNFFEDFVLDNLITNDTYTNNNKEDKKEETEPDDFNVLYGGINYSFIGSIYDYVFNGYFDESKLREEILFLNNEVLKKRPKAEYQLLNELRYWRNKSDEEFLELIDKIKQNLKDNKYTLFDILNSIIEYFFYFTSKGLLSEINSVEDLDTYLSSVIKNIKPSIENSDSMKFHGHSTIFRTRRLELKDTNLAFAEKQAELIRAINEEVFTLDLENLKKDINFLSEKKYNEPFEYLLENMNIEELSDFAINLLQTKNEDFEKLNYYLSGSFLSSNAGDFHFQYKDKLDKLLNSLELRNEEVKGKIKNILLEEFKTNIKVKSKHLGDSKRG